MNDSAKISVIILTYNSAKFVEETVLSALHQSLPPFEIIVADDCSTDHTWALLEGLACRHQGVIKPYRNDRNLGISRNLNRALEHVSNEWFLFGGGDDPFDPRLLEALWQAVRGQSAEVFAFTNVKIIDETGKHVSQYHDEQSGPVPQGDIFIETASRQLFNRSNSLFRNELVLTRVARELCLSDNELESYQDWDFKNRLAARCQGRFTNAAWAYYRIHRGGFSASNPALHARAFARVYQKLDGLLSARTGSEQALVRYRLESDLAAVARFLDEPEHTGFSPTRIARRLQDFADKLDPETRQRHSAEIDFRKARVVSFLLHGESDWKQRFASIRLLFRSLDYGRGIERMIIFVRLILGPTMTTKMRKGLQTARLKGFNSRA